MQNTVCAIITVMIPRLMPIARKKIKLPTAEIISGTMSGRLINAYAAPLPRKPRPRTMAIAARSANIVASVDAETAMINELTVALWISGLAKTLAYQANENPPHSVIERVALNE